MTDYAVVVGIARYPLLAHNGFAQDLEGPDNDAHAVREWLVDPDGGRLDPANVRMVGIDRPPSGSTQPLPDGMRVIVRAFEVLGKAVVGQQRIPGDPDDDGGVGHRLTTGTRPA